MLVAVTVSVTHYAPTQAGPVPTGIVADVWLGVVGHGPHLQVGQPRSSISSWVSALLTTHRVTVAWLM